MKFKSIINEFYRDLPWVDDEYQRGETIDFEDATLENATLVNVEGGTDTRVNAEDTDGTTLVANVEAVQAGTNLDFTDDGDGSVTLDASDEKGMVTADKQAITTHPVPMSKLADTDYVDLPLRVPSNKTVKVWKWGSRTDAQTTPAGLTVGLYDYDAAAYVTSANTAYATGSPLASHAGAGDLALRLENATGGTLNAGADFSATIE